MKVGADFRYFHLFFLQDCQDSLQNSEPEIRFALDSGEQLVDDDLTDPEKKQKIQEDVVELERTLKDLKEDVAKEKIRCDILRLAQLPRLCWKLIL